MDFNKQIKNLMSCADGSRLGEHDILPSQKKDFLSEDVKAKLRAQWSAAGRDAATIYAKLDEENGASFFITGWDGKGSYAGIESGKGFGYLPVERLQKAKLDESWKDSYLGHVRQSLSEMERSEVEDLVQQLHRCVTKRSKDRRKSEVKNFIKKFEKMMAKDAAKEPPKAVSESYKNEVSQAIRGFPVERKPLRSASKKVK
jgi:ribosomal protein S20